MKTSALAKFPFLLAHFLLGLAASFLPLVAAAATFNVNVGVGGNVFSPDTLTIQQGDTVRWTNPSGGMEHNVTSNNGSFPASPTAASFVYEFTFNSAGTFDYNCTLHGGMTGTITVTSSGGAAELVLTEVSAPSGSFAQGATISINAEVNNTGNAASGAFSIKYYASTNSSINAQDRLIGTENRASLPAGEDSSGPFNASIPADLAPGSYFIGAIVDFDDSSSADNVNVDLESITVTATGAFVINNGLNDTWKNTGTPRQGFFITVFPDIVLPDRPQPVMFLAWFTYDVQRPAGNVTATLGEPGHRWLTAYGPYSGDTATLDIELTQGGTFDSGTPEPTQTPGYGTITVEFANCSEGIVTYNIPSVGVSGTVPITRAANDNVVLCEAFATP